MPIWRAEATQSDGQIITVGGVSGNYYIGGLGSASPSDLPPFFSAGDGVWSPQPGFPNTRGMGYVSVRGPTDIFAVDASSDLNAPIRGSGGDSWAALSAFGAGLACPIIKAPFAGHVYALSEGATLALLHSTNNGSSWAALGSGGALATAGATSLSNFWVLATNDIYVSGSNGSTAHLYHWNGAAWSSIEVDATTGTVAFDVWADGDDIYVVGDASNLPVIWASHDGGSTFSAELTVPSPGANGVFLSVMGDDDGVFAAGSNGGVGILYLTPGRANDWAQEAEDLTAAASQINQVFTDGAQRFAVGFYTPDFSTFSPILLHSGFTTPPAGVPFDERPGSDIALAVNPLTGKLDFAWDDFGDPLFDDTESHAVLSLAIERRGRWFADPTGKRGSTLLDAKTIVKSTPSDIKADIRQSEKPLVNAGRITLFTDSVDVQTLGSRVFVALKWSVPGKGVQTRRFSIDSVGTVFQLPAGT